MKQFKKGFAPLPIAGIHSLSTQLLRGFIPLHPESPSLKTGDEQGVKLESTEMLRPVTKKLCNGARPLGRGVTGFTLVEILISLVILGLGLAVLFNIFPLGLQSLAYSRKLNDVSFLAQKKIEEVKSQVLIEMGQKSGEEGDLDWEISTKALKLTDGIEVVCVEMDIGFNFQGKNQKQRFVTYLLRD